MTAPPLALTAEESHPWVEAFLADQSPGQPPASLVIDERDEMWRYGLTLHHGRRDAALVDYFRAGLAAARVYEQTLAAAFAGAAELPAILDFACGWGRVSRWLLRRHPAQRLWVSDISQEALAFQRRELGVTVLPSALRPEELDLPRTFDAVLVGSLFTHLPRRSFLPWLARLFAALAPGGVLVFSTHGEGLLGVEETLDAEGFFFEEYSEIDTLDKAEYGRTVVSEGFVRRTLAQAVARVSGPVPSQVPGTSPGAAPNVPDTFPKVPDTSWPVLHVPRGLWHLQDLWVVPRDARSDVSRWVLDCGPDGRVETCAVEGGRELRLTGWVAHPTRPELPVAVEVRLAGERVGRFEPAAERLDVAAHFRRDELPRSGWAGSCRPPRGWMHDTDPLLIKAVDGAGGEMVLHCGSVESLEAATRETALRRELAFVYGELQKADRHLRENAEKFAAMEASRFWKLRNLWWRVKGGKG
jgi:SAM-dependent methyltransferase